MEKTGVDMVTELEEILVKNDLSSIADCQDTTPVIIQSFDLDPLIMFEKLSDLPMVYLLRKPSEQSYDYDVVGQTVHGVGPDAALVFTEPDMEMSAADYEGPSSFVTKMHGLDLIVHPWEIQDDYLKYGTTVYSEVRKFVYKGIDGVFTEFPESTEALFTHFGSQSPFKVPATQIL